MLEGFFAAFSPTFLLVEIAGVIIGVVFGAIPGLTATLAIALFVPVTFLMRADAAMIMLGGIYAGAIYGGSISAILINIPGTPASVITAVEGNALARKGKAPLALSLSALSSGIGGLFSATALLFLTPALSSLALTFGPAEYCALLLFSFTIVTFMLETPLIRNLLGCFIGLLVSTVGLDPVTGAARFTFGSVDLMSGFNLIAVLVGFFCMTEAVFLAYEAVTKSERSASVNFGAGNWTELATAAIERPLTYLRSSVIGLFLGILPAVGPVETPFISHTIEGRFNRRDPDYGHGSLSGLIASETSISANVGGSLMPLISLGIPGSGAAAVFIGALTLHGLQPGPLLFKNQPELIYTFFFGFIAANLFMMLFGLFGAKYFAIVLKLPKAILGTFVAAFSILGSYAINNSLFDVGIMFGATALALWLRALRVPILPIVLALVLGPLLEQETLVLFTTTDGLWSVLQRPIADVFFALSALVVVVGLADRLGGRRKRAAMPKASIDLPDE